MKQMFLLKLYFAEHSSPITGFRSLEYSDAPDPVWENAVFNLKKMQFINLEALITKRLT